MLPRSKSLRWIAIIFLLIAAATTVIANDYQAIANSPSIVPPQEETMFRFEDFDERKNINTNQEHEQAIKAELLALYPPGNNASSLVKTLGEAGAYCTEWQYQEQPTFLCRYRYPVGFPFGDPNPQYSMEAYRAVTIFHDKAGKIIDLEVDVAYTGP